MQRIVADYPAVWQFLLLRIFFNDDGRVTLSGGRRQSSGLLMQETRKGIRRLLGRILCRGSFPRINLPVDLRAFEIRAPSIFKRLITGRIGKGVKKSSDVIENSKSFYINRLAIIFLVFERSVGPMASKLQLGGSPDNFQIFYPWEKKSCRDETKAAGVLKIPTVSSERATSRLNRWRHGRCSARRP